MKQHGADLLYSERFLDKKEAARREREIKGWRREKKMALIKSAKVSLP
jgi:predicted GIY-YIG superfamily endonuclease